MPERANLTYHDMAAMPDDGLRHEIIGGELYLSPAPVPLHQKVVLRLGVVFEAYARGCGGDAYVAPVDVRFARHDCVEPDVLLFAADRLDRVGEKAIDGSPSLVVEVLSPGTAAIDRRGGRKYELYAQYAVPEYWVVDVKARSIDVFSDPDSVARTYRSWNVASGMLHAATLDGLIVDVQSLFV